MPVFLTGLSKAQTFSTGSALKSSCQLLAGAARTPLRDNTYSDCDEITCSLDLPHMGYPADFVRLEAADDLPA